MNPITKMLDLIVPSRRKAHGKIGSALISLANSGGAYSRYAPSKFALPELVEIVYKGNPTAFACFLVLALNFPEPEIWPFETGDDGKYKKIQGHPWRDLIRFPNDDMGEAELMKFVITYAPLGGNAYVWKQRAASSKIVGLWPLHDGQVIPIKGRTSEEGLVAYYVLYTGKGNNPNPYGVERHPDDYELGIAIPKTEIIHWKWMVDPLNPHRGIGALEASAGEAQVATEIRNFIFSLLRNDATPPVVVTLVEDEEADDDRVKRLRRQWQENYGGINRGAPAFLEAGMKVEKLGFDLKQLEIASLRNGPDAAVCMGFHLHPTVVGALVGLEHSTYSNQEEARRALTMNTLVPLWRSFASEVHQAMRTEAYFDKVAQMAFDLEQVAALQEDRDKLEARMGTALDRGAILRSEYRQSLGLTFGPDDEVRKAYSSWTWVKDGDPVEPLELDASQKLDGMRKNTDSWKAAFRKSEASYGTTLRSLAEDFWSGARTSAAFLSAWKEAVERGLREAFEEGAAINGILPDELTQTELDALEVLTLDNTSRAEGLADFIYERRQGVGELASIWWRVDLWTARYTSTITIAKTLTGEDLKYEWVMNPANENCKSCQKLNGKVKRASYWHELGVLPRQAGASYLECKGYNCECDLVQTDKPLTRGAFPGLP